MTLWIRFRCDGQERFGVLNDGRITPYRGDMFDAPEPDGAPCNLTDVELLPPCIPRSFFGLWNNFRELATKTSQPEPVSPLVFIKTPGSILAPGGIIRRPRSYDGRIIYEGELGIVVDAVCRDVDEEEAERAIFGYTCVNDVTALDWLGEPATFPQWTRAKGCDTFGPFGPAIATGLDWSNLRIRTLVNGRERQSYAASDMIIPPARIISQLSREMTLLPGDLIACGTSVGVLPMRAGQVIEVQIEGIGSLSNIFGQEESA